MKSIRRLKPSVMNRHTWPRTVDGSRCSSRGIHDQTRIHYARRNEGYTMHDQTRSILRTSFCFCLCFVFVFLPDPRAPPANTIVQRGGQLRCTTIYTGNALGTLAAAGMVLEKMGDEDEQTYVDVQA